MQSTQRLLGRRQHLQMNNEPFILVIGTSHSSGSCADRDWKTAGIKNTPLLEYSDRWPSKMEADLETKVINLSQPGVINSRMLAILADAFDRGLDNCKAIIMEVRLGTGGSAVAYSGFQYYENFPNKWKNKLIRDIEATVEYGLGDWAYNRFFSTYAGGKVHKPGYSRKLLGAAFPYEIVPDRAVEDMDHYIEQRSNFYHRTDHPTWDDFFDIRNMQKMCELANIPFKWFHWSKKTTVSVMEEYLFTEYPNVGQGNMLLKDDSVQGQVAGLWNYMRDLGYPTDDSTIQCSCRHMNEIGMEIVYQELLKPRINQWLKNKL